MQQLEGRTDNQILGDKENDTWMHIDMEFLFKCLTQ